MLVDTWDRQPEDIWQDIKKSIVALAHVIPKQKPRIGKLWLSETAIAIAKERRAEKGEVDKQSLSPTEVGESD